MGTVFRKTATKPLPAGAEIFTRKAQRFARWKDRNGKKRTEPVTTPATGKNAGKDRIVVTARTFTAKYRDGERIVREVSTGCRDEMAARRVLADLERRAELVKARVMSAAEDAVADHQNALTLPAQGQVVEKSTYPINRLSPTLSIWIGVVQVDGSVPV